MEDLKFFIGGFTDEESIISNFNLKAGELKGAKVYFAYYGYGSYEGQAVVIFEKDGKLQEVNGSHCSCYGLEDQWCPEDTTWKALSTKNFYYYQENEEECQEAIATLVTRYGGDHGA